MKPVAALAGLLLVLVATPISTPAQAEDPVDCDQFPASGVGAFGPFSVAFDLSAQVACVTWWCAPPGYADYHERSFVNWGAYLDATGLLTFYVNGGEFLWNAKYSTYVMASGLVEAAGLDDYLWPMVASQPFTAVC